MTRSGAGAATGRRHRIAGVDRMWGDEIVVISVGPVQVPERAALVAAVRALLDPAGATGLGRLIDADGRHWRATTDPDGFAERAVVELAPRPDESFEGLLARVLAAGLADLPLRFTRCGDRFVLTIAHVAGDGYQMTRLLAAVLQTATTGEVPGWTRQPELRGPLAHALWAHFGRHPGAAVALARSVLGTPSIAPPSPLVSARSGTEGDDTSGDGGCGAAGAVACRVRSSSPAALSALKAWRKAYASGSSTIPLTIAATEIALRRLGVPVSDAPLVLFDARRYLPAARAGVPGNFCAGLRLAVADRCDARQLDDAMHSAVTLGRPVAVLAAGALTSLRRRPTDEQPADGRWDVAYTHMAKPPDIARLPWVRGAGGAAPCFTGVLTPAGPAGVTFAFSEIGNRINASASFRDGGVDPALVEKALDLLCDDPAGLLEEHRA